MEMWMEVWGCSVQASNIEKWWNEQEKLPKKNMNTMEMIAYLFKSFIIVIGVAIVVTEVTSYFSSSLVFIDFQFEFHLQYRAKARWNTEKSEPERALKK